MPKKSSTYEIALRAQPDWGEGAQGNSVAPLYRGRGPEALAHYERDSSSSPTPKRIRITASPCRRRSRE